MLILVVLWNYFNLAGITVKTFSYGSVKKILKRWSLRKFLEIPQRTQLASIFTVFQLILISYQKRGIFDTFKSFFSKEKVQQSVLVITEDGGKTFHTVELPFIIRENVPFEFHPTKENWIIALEEQKTVMSITSMVNKVYVSCLVPISNSAQLERTSIYDNC